MTHLDREKEIDRVLRPYYPLLEKAIEDELPILSTRFLLETGQQVRNLNYIVCGYVNGVMSALRRSTPDREAVQRYRVVLRRIDSLLLPEDPVQHALIFEENTKRCPKTHNYDPFI